jgi:hypothetical protein
MLRPSSATSRLSMALMYLLQLRGYPRSKVGLVFNFHAVLGLHALEPILILRLFDRLDNLHDGIVVGQLVDLVGANQIETIGLLDGRANVSLFQKKDRSFDRWRIAAVLFHHAEISILGGGSLVVGVFARQLAKISSGGDLFLQILNLRFRLGFGG